MTKKSEKRTPNLRFKGFTDAWEQRKLGELANIVRGASPRPISDPKWFDEKVRLVGLEFQMLLNKMGRFIIFLNESLVPVN